jgi:hypothetical protein
MVKHGKKCAPLVLMNTKNLVLLIGGLLEGPGWIFGSLNTQTIGHLCLSGVSSLTRRNIRHLYAYSLSLISPSD